LLGPSCWALAWALGVGDGAAVRELGGLPHAAAQATTAIARIAGAVALIPIAPGPVIPVRPIGHILIIMRRFRCSIQLFA
jgi:hypothetical protein